MDNGYGEMQVDKLIINVVLHIIRVFQESQGNVPAFLSNQALAQIWAAGKAVITEPPSNYSVLVDINLLLNKPNLQFSIGPEMLRKLALGLVEWRPKYKKDAIPIVILALYEDPEVPMMRIHRPGPASRILQSRDPHRTSPVAGKAGSRKTSLFTASDPPLLRMDRSLLHEVRGDLIYDDCRCSWTVKPGFDGVFRMELGPDVMMKKCISAGCVRLDQEWHNARFQESARSAFQYTQVVRFEQWRMVAEEQGAAQEPFKEGCRWHYRRMNHHDEVQKLLDDDRFVRLATRRMIRKHLLKHKKLIDSRQLSRGSPQLMKDWRKMERLGRAGKGCPIKPPRYFGPILTV